MEPTNDETAPKPVKMVLERRAKPGADDSFKQWIKELLELATRSSRLQGSSVLTSHEGEYFILLRFASQGDLDDWQASPPVAELLRRGEQLATAPDQPIVRTGLETWFTLPGVPAPPSAPPRWKMALVTWLALLPQVVVLSFILPKEIPPLVAMAVSTAIPTVMLTWVIMPRLTKLLYLWLYAHSSGTGHAARASSA
ncbi:MAG: antibiotic biosynthesis monooxygenase [Deltaproteobacteria bacterium]|nr:antibiotic biosynthesis monooxygenase [Deltaproteobacteria bacterium]